MWEAKVNFFKTVSYNILLSCEAVLQKGIWCVEHCCMLRIFLLKSQYAVESRDFISSGYKVDYIILY